MWNSQLIRPRQLWVDLGLVKVERFPVSELLNFDFLLANFVEPRVGIKETDLVKFRKRWTMLFEYCGVSSMVVCDSWLRLRVWACRSLEVRVSLAWQLGM